MGKKKLMMVGLLLMVITVLIYAVPAVAQHVNTCPVGSSDQVGIAPHDYCNDTTFHNDRQNSPGDTTQTINDISPISENQSLEQDDFSSGNIDSGADILNQGDNSIMCPAVQQTDGTGNIGVQQGLEPMLTNFDEAELGGTTSETFPTQTADCAPSLDQNAQNQ